jgi:hypothetical protein
MPEGKIEIGYSVLFIIAKRGMAYPQQESPTILDPYGARHATDCTIARSMIRRSVGS